MKEHQFAVGDVVYLARNISHGKLDARFSTVKYVIIKFQRRDTCKIVSTVDGKTYVRNVKYLTQAPIDGRALLFDDVEENVEVSAEDQVCVKEPVIRTRSGRISKPTASKDCIYY